MSADNAYGNVYDNEALSCLTYKVLLFTIIPKLLVLALPIIEPPFMSVGLGVLYQNSTEKLEVPAVIPGVILKKSEVKDIEPGMIGVGVGVGDEVVVGVVVRVVVVVTVGVGVAGTVPV